MTMLQTQLSQTRRNSAAWIAQNCAELIDMRHSSFSARPCQPRFKSMRPRGMRGRNPGAASFATAISKASPLPSSCHSSYPPFIIFNSVLHAGTAKKCILAPVSGTHLFCHFFLVRGPTSQERPRAHTMECQQLTRCLLQAHLIPHDFLRLKSVAEYFETELVLDVASNAVEDTLRGLRGPLHAGQPTQHLHHRFGNPTVVLAREKLPCPIKM